jgi:hypothetical protein
MKKTLLFIGFTILINSFCTQLKAQCTISNLAIELKSAVPVAGGCRVIFDFSWNQEVNSGNKFAYLHLWRASQYPDLLANGTAYTNPPDYPTGTDLVDALATIVIDDNGTATPIIGAAYHPETSVPILTTGLSVLKEPINASVERMVIRNIQLIIPDCNGSGVTGDIWASQASNGKNVHCVSSNVSLVIGNPRVTGLLFCPVPRHYSVQIRNLATSPISVSYNIFIDEGDGIFEPFTHDLKITSTSVGPVTIAGNGTYQSGVQSYLPFSEQKPYSDHGLWVEVTTADMPNNTIHLIENSCIPLPVNFISFTVLREGSMVKLNWQTGSEQNNTGFEVQRKIGGGNFETIAFVPTLATGGNSEAALSYNYSDFNNNSSITEYRLKQIDVDRRSAYTVIKAVKGVGQPASIIIYPNPSTNGEVHILFDDLNMHCISVIDMNGRIIKQWNEHADNNLAVSGLLSGYYVLKFENHATGKITSHKFIVSR